MGRHSYAGMVGEIVSCTLLLGVLAFPAMVMSQTDSTNNASAFAPSAQQPPMGYGAGGYGGTAPAWGAWSDPSGAGSSAGTAPTPGYMSEAMGETMGKAMGGFMSRMQQPGIYPPGYGYGPYGGYSPDNAPMPSRQPSAGYRIDGGGYGEAGGPSPSQVPPTFGMFSSPQQGAPADRGMTARGNLAMPSNARGPFMGHGGAGYGGMKPGTDVSQLLRVPGLKDEQREKIYDVLDELRRDHWKLMGESMDHSAELRGLHGAERPDAKAIGAVYGKIFDVRRRMIESGIEARQKARDVLTDEQREQLESWGGAAGSGY